MKLRCTTYTPLMWGGVAAIASILAIVSILVWNARAAAALVGERSAANLLELINSDIARSIELHDQSLKGVVAFKQTSDFSGLPVKVQHAIMFGSLITTRALGAALVLNAEGRVIDDSTSLVPRTDNFSDRDYFKFHRDHRTDELYVGYLLQPRFEDRQPRLILSRRISDGDRNFQGIAVSGIRISYFNRLFQNLKIDPQSTISVFHADGTLIARRGVIGEPDMVGQNFSRFPNFDVAMRAASGTFNGRSNLDGIERDYVFSRIGSYPLVVVIGSSVQDVYQAWRQSTMVICAATAALCLGILGWLYRVNGELQQRRAHLTRANHLARTDDLTKLSNRRHFDERLSEEMKKCAQTGAALAVLLIDVDHFKSVNDRFGHAIGDTVLQSLARTIQRQLNLDRCVVARYGGEEFAAILPAVRLEEARDAAERIRHAVESGDTGEHLQSRVPCPLTVSIGLAMTTRPQENAELLVRQADEALYRAKNAGRNRVAVAVNS